MQVRIRIDAGDRDQLAQQLDDWAHSTQLCRADTTRQTCARLPAAASVARISDAHAPSKHLPKSRTSPGCSGSALINAFTPMASSTAAIISFNVTVRERIKIENVERLPVIAYRAHHALNDVMRVSVVAASVTRTEAIHRLAFIDQTHKFRDRKIGTLPRAVNGEITQAHDVYPVQVRKVGVVLLASNLGRGVRSDGAQNRSKSAKGTFLFTPYTEELDGKITRLVPASRAASSHCTAAFVEKYSCGRSIDGRTPARAARWMTTSTSSME